MSWIDNYTVEIIDNVDKLDKLTIKEKLLSISNECRELKRFDWRKHYVLVDLLPYIHYLTNKQRERIMQTISGQVLDILDNEDRYIIYFEAEEKDIPFLFELKHVLQTIWSDGYEARYMLKSLDIEIKNALKACNRDKFDYINMFFSKLEYPYTKQSLKKCKLEIIKENHPDNGGNGECITIIQQVYKMFLNYIK